VLAPAGDWECARAAVENGADAIYFGLDRFNARMRANNFTAADLPALMEFLHRRGVKGYVTFNTLVFENELEEAQRHLTSIIGAGVDAAIVQDIGICRLIRALSPDFPIHASTQMTITSLRGAEFAREVGCGLVVLARECSVTEIQKIQASARPVADGTALPLPLEVFIHGALCVAYSGQCLTSESLGGRSANRGECAQACRMPYELLRDGQIVPLGDRRYLLSPQDLAGIEMLPDLVRAGVVSLKIEGRLKSPEYVASITRVYRQAVDRICAGPEEEAGDAGEAGGRALVRKLWAGSRYDLEMAFSRGLFTGWFRGTNHQALVHARVGKKRGVFLGEVTQVAREQVGLRLVGPLKPGDGVVFDAGKPDEKEEGGRVYSLAMRGSETWLGFGHGDIDFRRVHVGDKLWKTSDPELERRLRQTFSGDKPHFTRPIEFETQGRADARLILIARDEAGHRAQAESAMPLVLAARQPLDEPRLRAQLGRLGGTPFHLARVINRLDGEVMLPVSELNRLRRDVVAQLDLLRTRPKRWTLVPEAGLAEALQAAAAPAGPSPGPAAVRREANLIVLVRNLTQLEAALRCGVTLLYCDFEDPKKYREAVRMVREAGGCTEVPREVWVAPPRIFKMGEEWTLKQVHSCEADGYVVRNYDHLAFFADARCVGDYSLNVANRLAAGYFMHRFGLERLTASYDLNFDQLEALLRAAPPAWFEVTIHQHMPMFHMEHCIFCAFLTSGTDYTNCGRPCDRHDLKLRDRVGAEHPVKADVGCRNTVFNARAQTGAEHVDRLLTLGVRRFRIEFVDETPEALTRTIAQYRKLLRGETSGTQLWRELKLLNRLGVTRGQFDKTEASPLPALPTGA
jgi:putative protease